LILEATPNSFDNLQLQILYCICKKEVKQDMTILSADSANIFEQIKRGLNISGYEGNLLQENYEFTDVFSSELFVKTIPLATFSQDPPSYQNACLGVAIPKDLSGIELISEYRSLGAPQIFEITSSGMTRWKISGSEQPQHIENIEFQNISKYFDNNKTILSPT
jgi:hypothetical protein